MKLLTSELMKVARVVRTELKLLCLHKTSYCNRCLYKNDNKFWKRTKTVQNWMKNQNTFKQKNIINNICLWALLDPLVGHMLCHWQEGRQNTIFLWKIWYIVYIDIFFWKMWYVIINWYIFWKVWNVISKLQLYLMSFLKWKFL